MKLTVLASFMAALTIGATGCSQEPKKAQYTVEQYLADRELMNKKVEECANSPGDSNGDPDCANAVVAAEQASYTTLRELDRKRRPSNSSGTSSPQ